MIKFATSAGPSLVPPVRHEAWEKAHSAWGPRASTARFAEEFRALGLPPGSDLEAVRKAFRKLALKHHPDKQAPGGATADAAEFREIVSAYDVLRQELGTR